MLKHFAVLENSWNGEKSNLNCLFSLIISFLSRLPSSESRKASASSETALSLSLRSFSHIPRMDSRSWTIWKKVDDFMWTLWKKESLRCDHLVNMKVNIHTVIELHTWSIWHVPQQQTFVIYLKSFMTKPVSFNVNTCFPNLIGYI